MNGRFQMQGGKNWILPKYINANRFFWDSHWLEIWSNHFCPSMGLNGGSVATDSVLYHVTVPGNMSHLQYIHTHRLSVSRVHAIKFQLEEGQAFFALVGFGTKENISAALSLNSPLRT
jgi:hypothetical protein